MKKKIVNFFLMAVMFSAVLGTTVSCKDYEEDNYSNLQDQLNVQTTALQSALATLQAQQEQLTNQLNTLSNTVTANKEQTDLQIAVINTSLETLNTAIDQINTTLSSNGGIDGLFTWAEIAGMWQAYSELVQYAGGDADSYVAMQKELMDFLTQLSDQGMSTLDLIEEVTYAYEKAQYIDGLVDDVASLQDQIDQANANYELLQNTLNEFVTEGLTSISELEAAIESLGIQITEIQESLGTLLNLESCLNQLVTSIIIQGTENPVYGTFSLPVGIQSNVLMAYYGAADNDVDFPTYKSAFYASGVSELTQEDINMLGVNSETYANTLLLGKGNAGTLYLTVNPNTVDFSGLTFSLENSVGENPGVALEDLTPSDHLLTFGYTRSTDNGLYEAKATVSEEALASVKPRVSVSDLKSVVSQLKNYVTSKGSSGLNVTDIITTLYTECNDILDANAVCAKWTDANGVEHKTYSNYGLAATAIKPLSYAFLQDADYTNFPGIGRLENLINRIFNKVQSMIPTFDTDSYSFSKIDSIELKEDGSVKTSVTVTFDKGEVVDQDVYIYDDNGNVIGSGHVENNELTIDIDLTEFLEQEYDEINGVIDEINSYLDNVNEIISELDKVNDISSSIDDIQSTILSYIDKINNKLCYYLNSVNKVLQPIVLVNTTDGFVQLSQIQAKPSLLSSGNDIVLIPTSFTAEVLAPAYKKVVGVTNVYSASDLNTSAQGGDSGCLSALSAANSSDGIAEVVDGDTRFVTLSNLKAGYIYEIAYTAVDYNGMVVAEKYYVKVAN